MRALRLKFKGNESELNLKSLKGRWLVDVLSIVVISVLILLVGISLFIYNFYHDSVRQNIMSRINISTEVLESYDSASDREFELNAKNFMQSYFDKQTFEVQVFDRYGNMIVSSQGFRSDEKNMNDYVIAKTSKDGVGEWSGTSESGESIMAITAVLPSTKYESMGAIRFVVSMEAVNDAVRNSVLAVILVGLFIIAVTVISGMLFLRSILRPVRAITDTAFRIASGDFDARLPVDEKDKSELGMLCDTINYMASELKSSENLKNDFISSVSHELRTPLTAIKGWGETVKLSVGNDEELTQKGVDIIIKETERLSGLVEDLLDFSRLQSGRLSIRLEHCDIIAELTEAVYMYRETAAHNGVKLLYKEPKTLPAVMADPARIKQVFINIIDNAVKYSSSGDTVRVSAEKHDVYIEVTVSDTGCGIAAEDLGKVKEKFYKANTTVSGSGIGLAVADEIIKQHNGILEVDSKLGEGTTVSIILPYILPEKSEKGTSEVE